MSGAKLIKHIPSGKNLPYWDRYVKENKLRKQALHDKEVYNKAIDDCIRAVKDYFCKLIDEHEDMLMVVKKQHTTKLKKWWKMYFATIS